MKEWRCLCEKPPKGFEKYFKPESKNKTNTDKTKSKDAQEQTGKTEQKAKPAPQKPSSSPGSSQQQQQGSKPYDQWSFGLFGGTGNRYFLTNLLKKFILKLQRIIIFVMFCSK